MGLCFVVIPPPLIERYQELSDTAKELLADLDSLAEPGGHVSGALIVQAARDGRCSILAAFENGEYVGVLVISVTAAVGGRVLDVEAARFRPGRDRGRQIEAVVRDFAGREDCRWIRMMSSRPGSLRHWKTLRHTHNVYITDVRDQ